MAYARKRTIWMENILKFQIKGKGIRCNYLVCNISFDSNIDMDSKIIKYQEMCGKIKRILHKKVNKDTRLKVSAVAFLLHFSRILGFDKNC
jgi:hypothetical protein